MYKTDMDTLNAYIRRQLSWMFSRNINVRKPFSISVTPIKLMGTLMYEGGFVSQCFDLPCVKSLFDMCNDATCIHTI